MNLRHFNRCTLHHVICLLSSDLMKKSLHSGGFSGGALAPSPLPKSRILCQLTQFSLIACRSNFCMHYFSVFMRKLQLKFNPTPITDLWIRLCYSYTFNILTCTKRTPFMHRRPRIHVYRAWPVGFTCILIWLNLCPCNCDVNSLKTSPTTCDCSLVCVTSFVVVLKT